MLNLKAPAAKAGKPREVTERPSGALQTNQNRVPLPDLHTTIYDEPYASMANPPKQPRYRPHWCPLDPETAKPGLGAKWPGRFVWTLLADNTVALTDAEDWSRLVFDLDVGLNWFVLVSSKGSDHEMRHVNVQMAHSGRYGRVERVARLVTNAHVASPVSYYNGDPRDLRKSNIRLGKRPNPVADAKRLRSTKPKRFNPNQPPPNPTE